MIIIKNKNNKVKNQRFYAKMQNSHSKYFQNLFQSSKFYIYSIKIFRSIFVKIFWKKKNLEKHFSIFNGLSLIRNF